MSSVDRLDFSKPPNDYLVWFDDGWSCVCWGLEDDGQAINTPDDNLTEEAATAAAWAHCKARHDPPGMRVESCKGAASSPRSGWFVVVLLHGDVSHWLFVKLTEAEARAAAWAWYEDALEVADLLGGESGPAETWPKRCSWPIPMRWSADERASVRAWAAGPGHAMPEVLRGL